MKDIVKISNKIENYSIKELTFAVSMHFLAFLGGIITTRAIVLERLLPFGLSYLSGISSVFTPAAAIGVFLGYFFPACENSGFKYIAAMFAILAIKLLLSQYKKIVTNPLFLTLISSLGCLLVSVVALKSNDTNILDVLTESLLCGTGTYFTAKSFIVLERSPAGLSSDELCSILITFSILIMGLNAFSITVISLGKILGILLILIASKYGGITSGAIAGIAVSMTIALSTAHSNIGIALAFSGLVSGIFVTLSKYAQVAVIIIFSFLGAATLSDISLIGITIIETIIASVIYISMPRKAEIIFGKLFSAQPKLSMPRGYKKTLTMRLELASGALKDVSQTVEQVSRELAKINSPDFSSVITAIEQDACLGCNLRVHCWETKRSETVEAVLEMTKAVKQGEFSPETALPTEFKGRCNRLARLGNATYKRYSEYASRIAAESRIDEVRSVVTDQFNGISSMLYDLSLDFKNDEQFDTVSAEKSAAALKNLGIHVEEASARIDKYSRMYLEFKLKKTPELIINKMQIMKTLSVVCDRDFDIPRVREVGADVFIVINERTDIKIDVGVKQIAANDSNMCGDAYRYFFDGKGHFIMILSDGMGTGGRAAVDGAMASGLMSRLIKAGFGYDCSLKILNSSMLFKSTDESLATLDIASIDLYTGQLRLYKAGAAPTIVRRSGKTGKAESTSLPAGILRDISFDKASVKCKVGDMVVLMSDGVTGTGTDWIRAEIEAWREGDAQSLAERLCDSAKRRRNDNHEDDITVLVANLEKAI
ncbi:MAG: SpoIIE family protein phosphatase [Clostridia bacterium]|nr:SpoIIE family protein phosphatase [Clostridia bacterium]